MAKYDPLRDYLRRLRPDAIDMSFREIEAKIGYMLPNIAASPDWWTCLGEPGPKEVQKMAWRSAGYDAELFGDDRVRFIRSASWPTRGGLATEVK